MNEIWSFIIASLSAIPAEAWEVVVEVIVGALVVSPVMLGLKKWWHVHSEKVMLLLVILGSVLTSAALYLRDDPTVGPWLVLVQGWLVFATTQPVYLYIVKPAARRISAWFNAQVDKAVQLDRELHSARVTDDSHPTV